MGIPNRVSDRADVEWVFNPLFKVSLPSDVEFVARSPEEDDAEMTKVSCENLLVKIFLGHPIVAFKVMSRGDPVPDPPSGRILCEVLAKFGEFSCHSFLIRFPRGRTRWLQLEMMLTTTISCGID